MLSDDQFEKLLGILEFLGKRHAVGDIIEHRDQEFRPASCRRARSRRVLAMTRFFEPRSTTISFRKLAIG